MTLSSVRRSSSSVLLATSVKLIDILLLFLIFKFKHSPPEQSITYVTRIRFMLAVKPRDYQKPFAFLGYYRNSRRKQ